MFQYKDIELETEGVYEPAEDSLLLARVIEKLDLTDKKFLEIGCGSGIQSIIAAKLGAEVMAVDINPDAVKVTKYNASNNGVEILVRRSNVFGSVRGRFDYIVFNSPYIPVEEKIKQSETWAGGKDIQIIEKFVVESQNHLNENGSILLLISSITDLDKVRQIAKSCGYKVEIKDQEKIPWEILYVLELRN